MGENSRPEAEGVKRYSCLECRTRKIRCDRRHPCSNCVKTIRSCSFIAPVRGKRPKTKTPKEGLHAKLRRYEELLKSCGVKIAPSECETNGDSDAATMSTPEVDMADDANPSPPEWKKSAAAPKEMLSSRYENSLWSDFGKEFPYPEEDRIAGTADDLNIRESDLFLHSSGQNGLAAHSHSRNETLEGLHPPYQILLQLWDIYVDRVDPLMKILHLPTFWSSLNHALHNPQDVPKSLEALICAFYLAVISALDQDECQTVLGCQKSVVVAQYERAARRALVSAGFLHTSNLMTLRAYLMYLAGVNITHRNATMFVLSGVAVRLARKMDLHQDGSTLGHSPFEAEMRRRLWWHIFQVDFRISDLLSVKPSMDLFTGNARMPLNVLDEDLSPEMVNLPPEKAGITPATICLIRCEAAEFIRTFVSPFPDDFSWKPLTNPETMIKQLEDRLETRYLRYCDPANTLHHLVSLMVRTALCKIKLFAHNPRRFASLGIKVPQAERDIIFANATKMLEYVIIIRENRGFNKYTWQIGTTFLWNSLLYVLIEARHRKVGPEVDRLWQLIGVVFSHYPQMFEKNPAAVYTALGNSTLEVWDDCLAAIKTKGLSEPPAPEYITALRRCRARPPGPLSIREDSNGAPPATGERVNYYSIQPKTQDLQDLPPLEPLMSYDFPNLLSFEMDADDWVQWDAIVGGEGSTQSW